MVWAKVHFKELIFTHICEECVLDGNFKTVVIGAVFGIIGVVVGSAVTGLLTLYSDKEKIRLNSALDSYKFDSGQYSVDFLYLKQYIDEMKNLSILKAKTIRKLADVVRKYPDCGSALSESCRPAHVQLILIMREEIGSGDVPPKDIDVLIRDKYNKAQAAFERPTK